MPSARPSPVSGSPPGGRAAPSSMPCSCSERLISVRTLPGAELASRAVWGLLGEMARGWGRRSASGAPRHSVVRAGPLRRPLRAPLPTSWVPAIPAGSRSALPGRPSHECPRPPSPPAKRRPPHGTCKTGGQGREPLRMTAPSPEAATRSREASLACFPKAGRASPSGGQAGAPPGASGRSGYFGEGEPGVTEPARPQGPANNNSQIPKDTLERCGRPSKGNQPQSTCPKDPACQTEAFSLRTQAVKRKGGPSRNSTGGKVGGRPWPFKGQVSKLLREASKGRRWEPYRAWNKGSLW